MPGPQSEQIARPIQWLIFKWVEYTKDTWRFVNCRTRPGFSDYDPALNHWWYPYWFKSCSLLYLYRYVYEFINIQSSYVGSWATRSTGVFFAAASASDTLNLLKVKSTMSNEYFAIHSFNMWHSHWWNQIDVRTNLSYFTFSFVPMMVTEQFNCAKSKNSKQYQDMWNGDLVNLSI